MWSCSKRFVDSKRYKAIWNSIISDIKKYIWMIRVKEYVWIYFCNQNFTSESTFFFLFLCSKSSIPSILLSESSHFRLHSPCHASFIVSPTLFAGSRAFLWLCLIIIYQTASLYDLRTFWWKSVFLAFDWFLVLEDQSDSGK